jgi:ferredoxin-nitrite reductase
MGRLYPDQMNELARVADEYGNGEIRLTTGQNAILANVPEQRLDSLLEEDLLAELSPDPSRFRRRMVACTGTDYCNLAQIDTKGRAEELSRRLDEKLGSVGRPLSLHWSGCPAGCGNHQAAEIGFRGFKARIDGQTVDAVAVYQGGRTGPQAREGKEVMECVPLDENFPEAIANLIQGLDGGSQSEAIPETLAASQARPASNTSGESSRTETQ